MKNMNKKSHQSKSPKKIRRYIRRREALDAAERFRVAEDGTRYIVRFTSPQRIQHWLLLLSFTTLGITGLAQTFESTSIGYIILSVFGGIESARQIHHVAAFIFGVTAIYHFGISIYEMFVYRSISRIWPDWSDLTNLFEMLKLNLGFSNRHPQFDRFTFEEKAEYWALIWGTIIMGLTGLMQWFPLQVTSILPGWMIPVANALHRWEAILAVLAILTWHMYHTLIKTRNFSIFDGVMTIPQMEEEHPVELAYLEHAASALQTATAWPALIEFSLDEGETGAAQPAVASKTKQEFIAEPVLKVEASTPAQGAEDSHEAKDESPSLVPALSTIHPVAEDCAKVESDRAAPVIENDAPITKSLSSGEA